MTSLTAPSRSLDRPASPPRRRGGPALIGGPAFAALTGTAGLGFALYPALRPYSSETGLVGARAFASWQWTAAHLAAVLAFALLAQLAGRLSTALTPGRPARLAGIATGLGATLVLPYYGAEAFGVGGVGRWALDGGSPRYVGALTDAVRFGAPALALSLVGLLLLAVGGVLLGIATWRSGARTAGVLLATGLVLYLPQFYLPPSLRIVHGVVLGLGLALTAVHAAAHAASGVE